MNYIDSISKLYATKKYEILMRYTIANPDSRADVLLDAFSLALLNCNLRHDMKAGELRFSVTTTGTPNVVTDAAP